MSTPGAASSNVDMLRLEYPRTITEVVEYTASNDESIEIREPPMWMRQMIHQYTAIRRDLLRMYDACGKNLDRDDRRIRDIEQNYQVLVDGIRYVYEQARSDSVATREWIQTELTATAQATQELSQQLWQVIRAKNEEDDQRELLQKLEQSLLHDALAFLQAAGTERDHEMAIYRRTLEAWAENQQATTEQLAANQQALRSEVTATQAAVRQVVAQAAEQQQQVANPQVSVPSFLQTVAPRESRVPRPTAAAIVAGLGATGGAMPVQTPAATPAAAGPPPAQPPAPPAAGNAAGAPPNQPPPPPAAGAPSTRRIGRLNTLNPHHAKPPRRS